MIPADEFVANLNLVERTASLDRAAAGCVIECGTWRGGMAAALAHLLGPEWTYHFFDSFRGLPPATSEDGEEASRWQRDRTGPRFFDNCTASRADFDQALRLLPAAQRHLYIHEGWFEDTFPRVDTGPITILRLDADWYVATRRCLERFWPHLITGAVVIIDDYHCWEGCRRAVHEFLSSQRAREAIRQTCLGSVRYIIKE